MMTKKMAVLAVLALAACGSTSPEAVEYADHEDMLRDVQHKTDLCDNPVVNVDIISCEGDSLTMAAYSTRQWSDGEIGSLIRAAEQQGSALTRLIGPNWFAVGAEDGVRTLHEAIGGEFTQGVH